MPTPSIQTLRADAQQVLNLDSISAVRSVVAATLANANAGTPLNPNLTTQQLWNEFYQIVTQPKSDIESIIANQLMKFLFAPPAPGGAGADKQVIFNDGGVLAGDPQFLWNKTTNLLTVTGSATITGDLTVDTSTLKVDSTNNRVGIGTATLFGDLNIQNGTNCRFELGSAAGGTVIENLNNARNAYLDMTMYADAYIWNRLGSEVMRLNSTGLGVGMIPANNLSIGSATYASFGVKIDSITQSSLIFKGTPDAAGYEHAKIVSGRESSPFTYGSFLAFYTEGKNSGTTDTSVERARFNSTGNLAFANGLGIDFSATPSGSGTMTSELLNDYEEGTWTIGLTFGGGNTGITTSANTGRYTKVGRQVTVIGYLALTNKGSSTGSAVITGLPFASPNSLEAFSAVTLRFISVSYTGTIQGLQLINSTNIELDNISDAGVVSSLTDSNFVNSSSIIISCTYTV